MEWDGRALARNTGFRRGSHAFPLAHAKLPVEAVRATRRAAVMEQAMAQSSELEPQPARHGSEDEQYTWTEDSATTKWTAHIMAVVWVVSMAAYAGWALYYMWWERIGPF